MQDVIDIEVTPLSAACGAEVKGIDLTKPLSDEAVRAVKDAWAKHLVLVLRGQTLSQDDQLRFASYFGILGDRKRAPEPLRGVASLLPADEIEALKGLVSEVEGVSAAGKDAIGLGVEQEVGERGW